jgi:hypothetical protein
MGEDRVNILRILTSTKWYQAVQIQKWYFHRLSLRYDTSNGWYSYMMQYFQRLRFWDDQSAEIRIYEYIYDTSNGWDPDMILPSAETQIWCFHRLRLRYDTSNGWDLNMILPTVEIQIWYLRRLRFFYKYSKETWKVFETIIDVSYGEQLWVIYMKKQLCIQEHYVGLLTRVCTMPLREAGLSSMHILYCT